MPDNVRYDNRVLRQLISNTPSALDTWLRGVAIEITGDIVQSFGTSPSQPGDPPGVDTGNLRAGMGSDKLGDLSYIIYAQAEYAPYLEIGTEHMQKRPFFTPVIENWRARKLMESARNARLIGI